VNRRRLPDVLAARHRPVLARFAASRVMLAFDFDGTLAPIAPRPAEARMRAATRRLLTRVATQYPTVVVSGRTLDDVSGRLQGIPLRRIYGTYGYEPAPPGATPPAPVRAWTRHLQDRLAGRRGIEIEEKTHSVTVHYRHAPEPWRAEHAIAAALDRLADVRVLHGPFALVLLPRRGPDKGVALGRARRSLGCRMVVFVGDDDTDEDAFASAPPSRLLAIRVGGTAASRARFRLRRQEEIDHLLSLLLELRSGRDLGDE
jgi:trehalose 6-phosphate phosphatase